MATRTLRSASKRPPPTDEEPLKVVLIACGEPKKSMGWFHLTQLLNSPSATMHAVVEPWFLGAGAGKAGSEAFKELQATTKGVHFCASVADVPAVTKGTQLLFLIAGRTCDAPRLFEESIGKGATHIYIEKPGGENAAQLRKMRALADKRGVAVIVGYNKNVAEYSRDAVAELRRVVDAAAPLPKVVLEHCNDFAPGEPLLDFLRGPGGEGMLHNMCCHELALACTLFGVRTRAITSIVLDRAGSELVDLGDGRTDWSRVRFTVHMAPSAAAKSAGALSQLTFAADRCGGNFSRITLDTGADGSTKSKQYRLPTAKHEKWMIKAQAADPDIRPYFLQQAPEYERLKSTFIQHILAGKPGIPEGVVGLDGAIEALDLADMLVPAIKQCWNAGEPWTWTPPKT